MNVLTGSADRDTDRFDDADEWQLGRPTQHHLAFGTGPHQCLGMHLARLELRAGLAAILRRLPEPAPRPRRRPVADDPGLRAFRGPDRVFDPVPRSDAPMPEARSFRTRRDAGRPAGQGRSCSTIRASSRSSCSWW